MINIEHFLVLSKGFSTCTNNVIHESTLLNANHIYYKLKWLRFIHHAIIIHLNWEINCDKESYLGSLAKRRLLNTSSITWNWREVIVAVIFGELKFSSFSGFTCMANVNCQEEKARIDYKYCILHYTALKLY